MVEAQRVFDRIPQHDIVSRNSLLFGYSDRGDSELVLEMFFSSGIQSARTLLPPLKACTDLASGEEPTRIGVDQMKLNSLARGMEVHSRALNVDCENDIFVSSSLIRLYSQCGSMIDARKVFDRMREHNVVTWNSLLLGYVESGEPGLALELFEMMRSAPNEPSFLAALKACSKLAEKEEPLKLVENQMIRAESLRRGAGIHSRASAAGLDSEVFVANSLIDMYSRCGSFEGANRVFQGMSGRSLVSFNSLILASAENNQGEAGLRAFFRMKDEGFQPNPLSFIAALKASSCSGVSQGVQRALEAEIYRSGAENDELLQACLVDSLSKLGSVSRAQLVFDQLPKRDLVTRTALMIGYSRHGDAGLVFELFRGMIEEKLRVDGVIFVSIFTACSHAGLVERGLEFFRVMSSRYGVEPEVEHYTCIVDLLGRGNRLAEAEVLLRTMPFRPSSVAWVTLLGACQKWKNFEVGRFAFESLIGLDRNDAAPYVLMANIYGSLGMWEEQAEVLAMKKGVKACSRSDEKQDFVLFSGRELKAS